MHFNVSQLLREHSGSSRVYDLDTEAYVAYGHEMEKIIGNIQLIRTDSGVWVSANLCSKVPSTCSRCAEEYNQSINLHIDEEALSVSPGVVKGQDQLLIDDKHTLDLTDAVRQYCALNMPMKPMCSDDCKGLCMTCSVNLNMNSCQCVRSEKDNRWDQLERIAVYINESGNEAN